MTKGVGERILKVFLVVKLYGGDRIAKRVYVGVCAGSLSVDRL